LAKAGRPLGAVNKDKPFREALRMELAALGESDPLSLRGLARRLLAEAASTAANANVLGAIKEVADRLDGKPAQEATVTIDDKRDPDDYSDAELVAILNDRGARSRLAAASQASASKLN
jgi:hypothetical protein